MTQNPVHIPDPDHPDWHPDLPEGEAADDGEDT